ncbi:hypothetical protein ACPOL_6723 [Acidisarcina polymorpha]|uniref:Lipocalin-like domain-containing protein n=1 Tax=Acidisarcina polymorpha TaxID=2211140 RepID=A0A2Z5GBC3_9BACT|nr:hypothetical protein [Acidisarcina polymorpha]AXC15935.1 hypothetical protein ACPOL_6723 [Acidisarcina polymorpha]
MKRGLQLLLIVCLAAGRSWAVSDPFVGKWKLDPSRSKVTDLMRVAIAGANKYNLIFNSGGVETVLADGTDQPGLFGTTVSITVAGPNNWTVVRKKNGRTLLMGNWKLSEDGKTLTDAFTSGQPSGSMSTVNYVYIRTAGNSGFPGSWDSHSESVHSAFELQIQPYEGTGLSFINASEASTKSMKFDGKDYPRQGKYVAPESVSSGRRVNDRTLELIDKIKGRIADTQRIELSPDLKMLTVTMQPSGQSKPNIFVFDRE